jgi:hypothetical protein
MVEYKWNPETHTATCKIEVQGKKYIGTAICHEHDFDFESEKVGQVIAGTRAQIKMLQDYEDLIDKCSIIVDVNSPIFEFGWKMFDIFLNESFNSDQVDWINWWLYERIDIITNEESPYYDGDKECYMHTIDDLWEYISKLK